MSGLGDRIRSSAMISARPGQMDDLNAIADEVDRLVVELARVVAELAGCREANDAWLSLARQEWGDDS